MKSIIVAILMMIIAEADASNVPDTFQNNIFTRGKSYSSPFGKRGKVILPDKTEVTLNSNTTIWLDKNFGKQNRDVQISGDALFNIKKSSSLFIIYTPHLIITTSAAIARVNAYADEAGEETQLLLGKIKVVKSYFSKLDHEPYFLKEGDMVMMNKDIDLIEKETFDSNDLKTWIADKIVFNNVSLDGLLNKLKSWFNVEIAIYGNVPENLKYTCTFTKPDLQGILRTVGKAWKFRYQAHKNAVSLKF